MTEAPQIHTLSFLVALRSPRASTSNVQLRLSTVQWPPQQLSARVVMDHDGPVNGSQSSDMESNQKATLSAVEMQDQMDQFTHIMHQKFLSGEDRDYLDYSKIDDDETLDDHWLREANYDAEDKYFAEDE
ncbi:hypothetical protein CK203_079118 [Vitis vinifera]|nr:hypothetical protein CK203_079118 [Vitis vinifera]